MINELALRYGRAMFAVAKENNSAEQTLNELRVLSSVFTEATELMSFFSSALVPIEARKKMLSAAVGSKLSASTFNFLNTLVDNDRLTLLPGVLHAFEMELDEIHGAVRGKVKSAKPLGPEERKKVEEQISKARGKKVILTFEEDPSLVGGMVAQVSGWTFDDSLQSHLSRISDDLNRRAPTWN